MSRIECEKLDKLYKEKIELEKRKLELEKEKLTLLLEIREITDGNGREKQLQQKVRKNYGLYLP